jgi:predicted nuclease of predicted toxin-antitoxin system
VRFFLDHDIPADAARVLRNEGHEVVELREALAVESSDEEVFTCAHERGMVLITCNRDDFLAIVAESPHSGLIILIRRRTRQAECANLLTLLDCAGEAGLAGNVNFA